MYKLNTCQTLSAFYKFFLVKFKVTDCFFLKMFFFFLINLFRKKLANRIGRKKSQGESDEKKSMLALEYELLGVKCVLIRMRLLTLIPPDQHSLKPL